MKRYYRIYELHNGEAIYFNFDLEPCDRKDAYLWSGPAYLKNPAKIAQICDEELDRTGQLLGFIRDEVVKQKAESK